MRTNAPLYSLNAGEVSKIALARVDVAKLRMAAACQVNWLPYVVGPMTLRPGLYYVAEVLGDAPARLVRFVFSKLDTALIELTANQMRVWINETLVNRATVPTAIARPLVPGAGSVVHVEHHVGRHGDRRRRGVHAHLPAGRRAGADSADRGGTVVRFWYRTCDSGHDHARAGRIPGRFRDRRCRSDRSDHLGHRDAFARIHPRHTNPVRPNRIHGCLVQDTNILCD